MNVTGTLDGLQLEPFTIPFLERQLENAQDITALDGTIYTDFINKKNQWELNWTILHEDQYNALKAVYDDQFSNATYPEFVCTYYSIDTPVRMYINDKDVRKDGCWIRNVQVTLTQESSSTLVS